MEVKKCFICGKDYESGSSRSKFCSSRCKRKSCYVPVKNKQICVICGRKFISTRETKKFCSKECFKKHKKLLKGKDGYIPCSFEKNCEECKKVFKTHTSSDLFCSDDCEKVASFRKKELACEYCSISFITKFPYQRFCSKRCARKNRYKKETINGYAKDCLECGKQFDAASIGKLYCSKSCKDKALLRIPKKTYTGVCVLCGSAFESLSSKKIYCSDGCMYKVQYSKEKKIVVNRCVVCDKEFVPLKSSKKCCSDECKWKYNYAVTKGKYERVCKQCGNKYLNSKTTAEFCSITCSNKFREVTVETREKLSISMAANWIGNKHNGVDYRSHYKRGYYSSVKNNCNFFYRSSWELCAFQSLEKNKGVKSFMSEPFIIKYLFEGAWHSYIPDIEIVYENGTKKLIEIKPDYQVRDKKNQAKFLAAKIYCDEKGYLFEVWTEIDIENLLP